MVSVIGDDGRWTTDDSGEWLNVSGDGEMVNC